MTFLNGIFLSRTRWLVKKSKLFLLQIAAFVIANSVDPNEMLYMQHLIRVCTVYNHSTSNLAIYSHETSQNKLPEAKIDSLLLSSRCMTN